MSLLRGGKRPSYENLNVYQCLAINYTYGCYFIHAVREGHLPSPLCANVRCNFVNCYKQ